MSLGHRGKDSPGVTATTGGGTLPGNSLRLQGGTVQWGGSALEWATGRVPLGFVVSTEQIRQAEDLSRGAEWEAQWGLACVSIQLCVCEGIACSWKDQRFGCQAKMVGPHHSLTCR